MAILFLTLVALSRMLWAAASFAGCYALPLICGVVAANLVASAGGSILITVATSIAFGIFVFGSARHFFATSRGAHRLIVVALFVGPAGLAGYFLLHGVVRFVLPSETLRQGASLCGAILVAASSWVRLIQPDRFKPTRGVRSSSV